MNFPITPYKIKKGFLYWKHFGTKEFLIRLADRMEPEEVPYGPWYEKHKASEKELERQRSHPIEGGPKFSVLVPAYHTPKKYLCEMIDSVLAQTYPDLELIIADAGASEGEDAVKEVTEEYAASDSRVRYIPLPENAGIAANTNAAAEEARGSFLAFLDHDDLIAPDALYEAAIRITSEGADMIYTDEDKIRSDGKSHFQPHLKPEFNIDLLRSNNYITHFLIVKKSLAEEAGLFDASMSGAQDYDFIFRCAEKAERIVRIPRILYHWRTHEASTADNPMSKQYAYEAGRRAIEGNLRRCGVQGTVEPLPDFGFYRVRYPADTSAMISVIIPNKDEAEALRKCVDSVLQTGYENLEIIIVENNSTSREIFDLYGELKEHPKIRLVRWKGKGFNYSAINNYGAKFARGEYLLFLNNDVYGTLGTEWLTEMLDIIDYVRGFEFVRDLFLCGHSQGGLCVMLAGAMKRDVVRGLIPLSPAVMIPDDARKGVMLGHSFDPDRIPDVLTLEDGLKLGGNHARVSQTIYVEPAIDAFSKEVLIIHGMEDECVPFACAREAAQRYRNATLIAIPGDDHCYNHHLDQVTDALKKYMQQFVPEKRTD